MPRIAVVGGGITGLAAAHRITELLPQAELALFEASARLGGVIETVETNGLLIERSADSFLTKLPQPLALCRRLGIADELIATEPTRRRALVVHRGRLVPVPEGFYLMSPQKLWPIVTTPILSSAGKVRLLAEPLVAKRRTAGRQDSAAVDLGDESVAAFVRRRLGAEAFERLVQPLVAGMYTANPETLSMAAAMPEFFAKECAGESLVSYGWKSGQNSNQIRQSHKQTDNQETSDDASATGSGARYALFTAPSRGMSVLVRAIAEQLPTGCVHLHTRVQGIIRGDDRWELKTARASAAPETKSFDAVIVAAPAHIAAELLQPIDQALATEVGAIEYAGVAVVSMAFRQSDIGNPLDGFGFVVPRVENRRIIAASFASQKFAGRAPAQTVLIRTFVGGALQPGMLSQSDADLQSLVRDELRDLIGLCGEPLMTDIARWPRSMPQYHVGHLQRIARIEQLTARHVNLALAGSAYRGVGVPQCVADGEAAAEQIAAKFAG